MGPRFFKRGERATSWRGTTARTGFNGATLLQAWRVRMCFVDRCPMRIASMGPRFFKRGEDHMLPILPAMIGASMGPRFFKRGEMIRKNMPAKSSRLQWGHASSSVESCSRHFFIRPFMKLQWGHASSSVESKASDAQRAGRVVASMGPRFFKRGEWDIEHVEVLAVALQWGHASSSVESVPPASSKFRSGVASMGPRFFKRGEMRHPSHIRSPRSRFNGATLLQAWRGAG